MKPVYRVFITEYERGYGQRPDGHFDFDTKVEAETWVRRHNEIGGVADDKINEVPDVYYKASAPKLIDLDDTP